MPMRIGRLAWVVLLVVEFRKEGLCFDWTIRNRARMQKLTIQVTGSFGAVE